MATAAGRRRVLTRIAQTLWIAWAIVVWNLVFDYVIVVAGRAYLAAAIPAAQAAGPYARMDDWMRPAITRGVWTATAASAAILIVGLVAIRAASVNRDPIEGSPGRPEGNPDPRTFRAS
jgi:hypothetical protein